MKVHVRKFLSNSNRGPGKGFVLWPVFVAPYFFNFQLPELNFEM